MNKEKCGHVNKQHYNTKSRLEDLVCDLEKDHKGDHHAFYQKNVPDHETDDKGRVTKSKYTQEEAEAYWGDMAGTPAKDISEVAMPQLSQFQKDLLGEVLKKNPNLTATEALAVAKSSPTWNALS